jgi:cytochrome c2
MPGVKLTDAEVEAMVAYLAAVGKFKASADTNPDVTSFPEKKLADGKNVFVLRCAQCHALGSIVKTPLASQQGPDLANVAGRIDYAWMKGWILDPRSFDPKSKMTVPGITPDEADAVRMFIWKMSQEEQKAIGTGGAP